MGVFRPRLHRDATDLIECSAPQYSARPAEKGRIPEVITILYEPMEEFPLSWHSAELPEVSLKRVGRIELMWCLQQSEIEVPLKPSQRHSKKRTRRNMVAIKDCDKFAACVLQCIIDV